MMAAAAFRCRHADAADFRQRATLRTPPMLFLPLTLTLLIARWQPAALSALRYDDFHLLAAMMMFFHAAATLSILRH